MTFYGFNESLAHEFPEVSFTATDPVDHCEKIMKQFADLPDNWTPTYLDLKRRLGRTLYLEADQCEVYDYYEDDLSAYGFHGTAVYSLQQETIGKVSQQLNTDQAKAACKKMYQDTLSKLGAPAKNN